MSQSPVSATKIPLRFVEVNGICYLHIEDCAALVADAEHVRQVVFDEANSEMSKAECVGVIARHLVARAIADRVAAKLTAPANLHLGNR